MTELAMVSQVLLWVLVAFLSVAVFALARQVGVLHARIAPAGALAPPTGPKVGELVESIEARDLSGRTIAVGGPADARRLLLFISPTCPVCKALVPIARTLARQSGLGLIFASDGDKPERHTAYVRDLGIEDYPYLLSEPLGLAYGVAKLPFAVLLDEQGVLLSKGLVNTREHLESLLEANRLGIETIQDYMRQGQDQSQGQANGEPPVREYDSDEFKQTEEMR